MSKLQNFDTYSALQLAQELYQNEQFNECIEICIEILKIDRHQAQVWNLAGIVMLKLGIYEKAIEYFQEASVLEPAESNHLINIAEAYRRWNKPQTCITQLINLLAIHPTLEQNSTLHFNLAKAYSDIEDFTTSIQHYTIAIKLDPNDLGAMFNLANAQVSLKNFGEAIELYLYALSKGYLDAGVNLASTYVQIGYFFEAIEVYEAIYKHYKLESDFLFNYANALNYAHTNIELTRTTYQKAIELEPKTEYFINYAHFLLKNQQFAQGFEAYEKRKAIPQTSIENLPNLWQGENLDGKKVLVHYEQGLGDSIMFARLLPTLAKIASKVIFLSQPPLVRFFNQQGIESYSSIDEIKYFDVSISLLSLPYALDIRSKEQLALPQFRSQTSIDSIYASKSIPHKGQKIKQVGICFSTDSLFPQAENKNIPLEKLMESLNEFKNIQIHSLNKAQIGTENLGDYNIINHADSMHDFADTSAILQQMDIVISIDTAVAHLSASMQKPTIVLLNKQYDWRWGNGVSTPWYESVLCITQSTMGDWGSVIQNLKAYLKSYLTE